MPRTPTSTKPLSAYKLGRNRFIHPNQYIEVATSLDNRNHTTYTFRSYYTVIAKYTPFTGEFWYCGNDHSPTTRRHLRAFMNLCEIEVGGTVHSDAIKASAKLTAI